MDVTSLYTYWARTRPLPPELLDRIFSRALASVDTSLLSDLLALNPCSDTQHRRVLSLGVSLLTSQVFLLHPAGSLIVGEHLRDPHPDLDLPLVLRAAPQHRATAWETASPDVRLAAVLSLPEGESLSEQQRSWLRREATSPARAVEVTNLLATHLPHCVWEEVCSWGDVRWVLLAHRRVSALDARERLEEFVTSHLDEVLASGDAALVRSYATLLVRLADEMGAARLPRRGSRVMELVEQLRASPLLPAPTRARVETLVIEVELDPRTDRDLLDELAVEGVTPSVLERVRFRPAEVDPILLESVCVHPEISPELCAGVLARAPEIPGLLGRVLDAHDEAWVNDLAYRFRRDPSVLVPLLHHLAPAPRLALELELVARKESAAGFLAVHGVLSEETLEALPLQAFATCPEGVLADRVLSLVSARLGGDGRAWEIFEGLFSSFEGSLGELLDASTSLNVVV